MSSAYARQQNAAYRHQARSLNGAVTDTQRIADLESQVARLTARLADQRAEIERLRANGSISSSSPSLGVSAVQNSFLSTALSWLTPSQFAARAGVSQSTISRALTGVSGSRVNGATLHLANGHWLIADTCTFVRQRKRKV